MPQGFEPHSRRSFLKLSGAAATFGGLRMVSEPMLAYAARQQGPAGRGEVLIDSNENPLGPCTAAREAVAAVTPQGGRYGWDFTDELVHEFARVEGLKPEYVRAYAGSGEPLHFAVLAFTSPARSYVTADPGYEAGMIAAKSSAARVVKVRLTRNYAHDAKAMIAAAPDAGLFYLCSPNNPTGTLTSHSEIEYLLENKPKGSVLMVDEAYIHFSDTQTALDLVKAEADIIVLRTFSKLYGMAGLRCGLAIASPDLLARLEAFGGSNPMPVTAVAAATASLRHAGLVAERKRINAEIRQETFDWMDRNGYSYIPSQSNCFMVDTKRPAKEVIDAMARQGIRIGRIWPVMPTYSRITVGTREDMAAFQEAFKRVMDGKLVGQSGLPAPMRWKHPRIVS